MRKEDLNLLDELSDSVQKLLFSVAYKSSSCINLTGLFIPNMAIGAIMGRMVGVAMEQLVFFNRDWCVWEVCDMGGGVDIEIIT